jgi:hypothetical protein
LTARLFDRSNSKRMSDITVIPSMATKFTAGRAGSVSPLVHRG